jgi:predicted dehydrogenase
LAEFLAAHQVEVTASLPCYSPANVDRQRGDGVFERSIAGLQQLNALGYGQTSHPELVLNLVYNPQGPALPPPQEALEADYKRELLAHFGIRFNQLFALTNMPVQRFGSTLVSQGGFAAYMQLLRGAYRAENLDTVMCRTLISVDWQGQLYDCDFNWRVLAEDGGNLRAVADIGTHWLDLVQFIVGSKVSAVCADLRTVHATRQRPGGGVETFSGKGSAPRKTEPIAVSTDDCGCVMLRFDNGANGCLWVSQTTAGRKNCLRFEIAGSQQSFAWNSEVPNELWIGHRDRPDRPNEMLIRDPALMSASARAIASYPGGHNEGFPDTFKQLFRSFYGYVAAGDFTAPPPFPTFADGHREVLLCEAVLRSAREGRWVEVST